MQTATKPLGAILPGIISAPFGSMASPLRSLTASDDLDLTTLPDRLDDQTLTMLREIALSPLPEPERCPEAHFNQCMLALNILPRRAADDVSGKLMLKLYRSILGAFSHDAMSYLAKQGLIDCQWFPTPNECLRMLQAWPNREVASARHDKASLLAQREYQHRLDETLAMLERRELDDDEVSALPRQAKAIGWTKGYLWKFADGTHAVRPNIMALEGDALVAARDWVRENADRIVHG
jgi:hypothetical protein